MFDLSPLREGIRTASTRWLIIRGWVLAYVALGVAGFTQLAGDGYPLGTAGTLRWGFALVAVAGVAHYLRPGSFRLRLTFTGVTTAVFVLRTLHLLADGSPVPYLPAVSYVALVVMLAAANVGALWELAMREGPRSALAG